MEHISAYLQKYRNMIAEYDERVRAEEALDSLQVALKQQGTEIEHLKRVCKDALEQLGSLEERIDNYERVTE